MQRASVLMSGLGDAQTFPPGTRENPLVKRVTAKVLCSDPVTAEESL